MNKIKSFEEIQSAKYYKVEYLIEPETEARLQKLAQAMTGEHKKRGSLIDVTPERAFDLAMHTGCVFDIEEKISFVELQYGVISYEEYTRRMAELNSRTYKK